MPGTMASSSWTEERLSQISCPYFNETDSLNTLCHDIHKGLQRCLPKAEAVWMMKQLFPRGEATSCVGGSLWHSTCLLTPPPTAPPTPSPLSLPSAYVIIWSRVKWLRIPVRSLRLALLQVFYFSIFGWWRNRPLGAAWLMLVVSSWTRQERRHRLHRLFLCFLTSSRLSVSIMWFQSVCAFFFFLFSSCTRWSAWLLLPGTSTGWVPAKLSAVVRQVYVMSANIQPSCCCFFPTVLQPGTIDGCSSFPFPFCFCPLRALLFVLFPCVSHTTVWFSVGFLPPPSAACCLMLF